MLTCARLLAYCARMPHDAQTIPPRTHGTAPRHVRLLALALLLLAGCHFAGDCGVCQSFCTGDMGRSLRVLSCEQGEDHARCVCGVPDGGH